MSKVFEEEYRQLAQDDLPDLWERIEAGLSEKTVEPVSAPKVKIRSFRKYTGLIAACLCAAVVIPAAVSLQKSSKSMQESAYDMAAPASEEAYDMAETTSEETELPFTDDQFTAIQPGNGMTGAAGTEAAPAPETAPAAEALDEEAIMEEAQAAAEEQSRLDDHSVQRQLSEAKNKGGLTDGMIIKAVSLKIIAVEEAANAEAVTVYTAVVQEDPNGLWTSGEEMTFTKGLYVEEELAVGESYQVNLHYYADEPYLFEVSKIIK